MDIVHKLIKQQHDLLTWFNSTTRAALILGIHIKQTKSYRSNKRSIITLTCTGIPDFFHIFAMFEILMFCLWEITEVKISWNEFYTWRSCSTGKNLRKRTQKHDSFLWLYFFCLHSKLYKHIVFKHYALKASLIWSSRLRRIDGVETVLKTSYSWIFTTERMLK